MKNKLKLIVASIFLTGTVFAQQINFSPPNITNPPLTPAAAKAAADEMMKSVNPIEGKFESVPGGNPFVFCSGPRPPKRSPLSAVYDRVCIDAQALQPKPPNLPNLPKPPELPQINLMK